MMYKHLFSILVLSTVIVSTASARYIRWEEFSDERFISYVATLTKLGSPQINLQDSSTGRTPLIEAVVRNLPDSVHKLALNQNIDINIKDNDKFTALMHAIKTNRSEIVRILLLNVNHRIMKYFAPDSLEYKTLSKHRTNAYKSDIPEQVTNYARSRFITHKS